MNMQRLMAVLTASLCCLTTSPATLSKPAGTLSVIPDEAKQPAVRSIMRDVPAGARVATDATQILEVLFTDGSSLTLGPNTEAVVAAYEYDPQSRMGRLEVRVSRGQLRVAGGALNNTAAIVIDTPAARLELDNGSAFLAVEEGGRTRTHLLLGRRLRMSSGGKTKALLRPGFELVATDPDTPSEGPKRMQEGRLLADTDALNPWLRGGPVAFEGKEVAKGGGEGEDEASQVALLEESQARSDVVDESQDFEAFVGITGGRPGALTGVLDPAAGFGGNPLGAGRTDGEQATTSAGGNRTLTQNRDPISSSGEDTLREPGATTNRIYNAEQPFSQVVGNEAERPTQALDTRIFGELTPDGFTDGESANLQYGFEGGAVLLDNVGDEEGIGTSEQVIKNGCAACIRMSFGRKRGREASFSSLRGPLALPLA